MRAVKNDSTVSSSLESCVATELQQKLLSIVALTRESAVLQALADCP